MQRRAWDKRDNRGPLWLQDPPEETEWMQDMALESRPRVRSDCRNGPRPCAWVGCRYHLFLDLTTTGAIKADFNTPPWEMNETCSLDLIESRPRGMTLSAISLLFGLTSEMVRLIVDGAKGRLSGVVKTLGLESAPLTIPAVTHFVREAVSQGEDAQKIADVIDIASALDLTADEQKAFTQAILSAAKDVSDV